MVPWGAILQQFFSFDIINEFIYSVQEKIEEAENLIIFQYFNVLAPPQNRLGCECMSQNL